MRKASIVVLLGLATLTNAAAVGAPVTEDYGPKEPVPEKRFIITPTKMNSAEEKDSKMTEFWNSRSKYNERIKSWVAAKEDLKKASDEATEIDNKIKGKIEEDGDWVNVTTKLGEAEKEVTDLTGKIAVLNKNDKDDIQTIAGLKEAVNKADEAGKKAAQTALDAAEKKLAAMETAKPKWEAKVTKYKKADAEHKKGTAPAEQGKGETAPWNVEKAKKDAAKTKAEGEVDKFAETSEKAWEKDGKPTDDGGAGYWLKKMKDLSPTMHYWTPSRVSGQLAVGTDPVAKALDIAYSAQTGPLFDGMTFEGFFGDAADNKFIVKGTKTLEELQEQLKYKLQKYKGKEEEAVIATVEEAKDTDKCNLIISTLVKMAGDTYDDIQNLKDHSAEINGFVLGLQEVTMTDRIKQEETPKGDGSGDVTYDDVKAAGDPPVQEKDQYVRYFINVQGMGLDVYRDAGAKEMFSKRDEIEIVGDMNAISAGPAAHGGKGGDPKDKDGGSNTWMIVAIIFIVIVVLGALFYAYQIYNASGSLQNTDI